MSPTLYTAKNNGGDDNGDSTTMVIATTMANNGIRFGDIQSTFPSSRYRAVSEPYKSSGRRRARSRLFYLVLKSLVTGLQKDCNQTGLRPQKTELRVRSFDF